MSNIKEFWPFDVWKRIPTNFQSFWPKNHWQRTILSRVMILFGFNMVPYGTLWYRMVPYGTLCYLMVPYGTLWYLMVPYGTIRYLMVKRHNKKHNGCVFIYIFFKNLVSSVHDLQWFAHFDKQAFRLAIWFSRVELCILYDLPTFESKRFA